MDGVFDTGLKVERRADEGDEAARAGGEGEDGAVRYGAALKSRYSAWPADAAAAQYDRPAVEIRQV